MPSTSQQRANAAYRRRLAERGLSRYEVRGLEHDKPLIRSLAGQLAAKDATARAIRVALKRLVIHHDQNRGGILAALRRSPLVGAELDLTREEVTGRDEAG